MEGTDTAVACAAARRRGRLRRGRGPPPAAGRAFSKYLPRARAKRLPLTPKRAGKGCAKGSGARPTGRRTRAGRFVVDAASVVRLVAPAPGGRA